MACVEACVTTGRFSVARGIIVPMLTHEEGRLGPDWWLPALSEPDTVKCRET